MSFQTGWKDIIDGAHKWRIWYTLGSGDIRRRYARTRLGQFWISLSLAISAIILGLVWSVLWGAKISEFLPYVVVSLTLWNFLSTCITESTETFMTNKHFMLGQKLEISVIIYALITRNILYLLHNLIIVVVVFTTFQVTFSWMILLFIPGLIIVSSLLYFISFFLAIICLRFTDVKHIINSTIQLLFYITPVIWQPSFLSEEYRDYLFLNPFYWFMSILRDPLIGGEINTIPWILTIAMLAIAIASIPIFVGKYVHRLIFWV